MALFRNKCENEEYLQMNCFIDFIEGLLKKDEFISKSMYMNQFEEITPLFNEFISLRNKNVLDSYCKKQKINFRKMVNLLDYFSSFNDFIVRHNDSYVNNHLISDKVYLDNVLKDDDPNISLDEEQRRVVLSDEDYTLVVAGAGAGKTTTIEAKVKYLVDIKHIDPERILIVSFTRKATKELKDRINKRLKINAYISTFHSIGNTIIKNEEENKYRIVDVVFMFDAIKNYLFNKLDDEYFINKIVLFFSSYLNISFSSKDTSLLFKELNKNNFVTLRSDLENIIERYKGELDKKRITLNDERVRSNDELRIANFLYINGIDYEYDINKRVNEIEIPKDKVNDHTYDLTDYKFFCFGGEPCYCQVIRDRHTRESIDFYDMEWNHQSFVGLNPKVSCGTAPIVKPVCLELMKDICRTLSSNIPFLRVDLYVIDGKVYFGELTFYPASGIGLFKPKEWNEKFGKMIEIN